MKILFVVGDMGVGGIQLSVSKLLAHGCGRKHLALFRDDVKQPLPPDTGVHALQPNGPGRRWLQLGRLPIALRQLVRAVSPDVVIGFGFFPGLVAVAATRGLRSPPKTAVSLRCSLEELERTRGPLSPLRLLTPWALRLADRVVVVADAMRAELALRGVAPHRIAVIKNGYDVEAITALGREPVANSWLKESRDAPLVVAVGRLSREKNFGLLIEALARVRRVVPARLAIVGDGPAHEGLRGRCADLGLSDAVRFLGHRPNPHAYVARADLFALTSLWEGFPNALCEAMIVGTPVISVDCPTGPSEIIEHGVTGMLVSRTSPDAIAEAIVRLLRDDALRKRLSAAARAHVARYTIAAMTTGYDRLFSELAPTAALPRELAVS